MDKTQNKDRKHIVSDKQLKYLTLRANGYSQEKSKEMAGYSKKTRPSTINKQIKANITLRQCLEDNGISHQFVVDKIKDGLESTKNVAFAYKGRIVDKIEIPDNETQHKYFRDLLEIRGDIDSKNDVNVNIGMIGIDTSDDSAWQSKYSMDGNQMLSDGKQSINVDSAENINNV